jgi:hypothetical protein
MSEKYPGGFVTYNPPTPSQTSATGIWTLSQQQQYQQAGLWPYPGYNIQQSLRFNSADSAYLSRTPATATNQKTWTWSGWVKRSTFGTLQTLFGTWSANTDAAAFAIYFGSGDTLGVLPWSNAIFTSTAVFRDPSAWYHIVVAFDSTQATASNRVIVYVNGVNQAGTYPLAVTQNANYAVNSAQAHRLGDFPASGFNTFGGYMTEVNFIDGQALTPSSFGETNAQTGVWQPKAYTGTYGTNGFYVNFSDNSNTTPATLGKDYSGNGNNWSPNNFSVSAGANNDSLVDVPTQSGFDNGTGGNVRGNYCTWNAVLQTLGGTASTYTNGNLVASSTGSNWVLGTIRINDTKYYFELVPDSAASGLYLGINSTTDVRIAAYSGGIEASPGGGSNQGSLASWSNGDVIGVAVDGPNKTVQFYRNGSTYGTLVTYTTALDLWPFARNGGVGSSQVTANFGQRPFAYTAPSGFKALCTQNLPTPTIGATTATQAGKFFNPVLYTGTGSSQSITGVGFQPDWVWVKGRSGATDHGLYDAVRGVQKQLESNNTGAETTETTGITAFGSDGFTTGALAQLNTSAATYVAWNWKANGSGSTNTSGSITSTVSANTTSGFSVVTYTGSGINATVGHGLGAVPKMMIVKGRSTAYNWRVYHVSTGNDGATFLNTTAAFGSNSAIWNTTTPTSSVFSIGTDVGVNQITSTYVAYCFAEVAGYSKFGSYTGNGSTDGPFVYCGFRPAWIMLKRIDATGEDWFIYDATRNTSNANNLRLEPNLSDAEVTTSNVNDFLSNGFKIRNVATSQNSSGINYIFAAFATAPFKYSLAR